jgi:hypothetical protein
MATATFVVRFWRETAADEERWRGRIEHVQSGKSAAFLDFESMLSFLKDFGIELKDRSQLARDATIK